MIDKLQHRLLTAGDGASIRHRHRLDLHALAAKPSKRRFDPVTTPSNLITDLWERITFYDLKVVEPTAVQRADGKWDVTVTVEARKMYADGQGTLTETPLEEQIEVGLFTEKPGRAAFDKNDILLMERQPIKSGNQVLKFVTAMRPLSAGVDPCNFYIDRRSHDNLGLVQ